VRKLTKENLKLISLGALANRNAKAGVKPTPALIETTANPKRCSLGLSRKILGRAYKSVWPKIALIMPHHSIFLMLLMNFTASSACFSAIPVAANVRIITTF